MPDWGHAIVQELQDAGLLLVEDGNHGEYRPRRDEFGEDGVAFVRAADMDSGRVNFDLASHINQTARDRIRKGIGRPFDVLLSHKGTVGKVGWVGADPPAFVCSPQTTFYRSLDHSALEPRFLYFYLQSPSFKAQLASRKGETDMADYVSLTEQRRLRISMPPLPEQCAIAEVLGSLDDKIEVNRRVAHLCSSLGAAIFAAASKVEARLADVAEVLMGQSPPGSTYNEDGNGLPFYQGTRDFGFRSPGVRVWCSAPSRIAERGDVLLSVRAPVGSLNVATQRCAIGRGVASVRSRSNPSALFQALAANPGKWEQFQAEGTVFGSIGGEQLRALQVEWPLESELKNMEAILGALDSCLWASESENEWLASLRDTLLPKLLSGELRVRDAESLVGEAV